MRAEALASEQLGTMTPRVVQAIKDAGLFWMLLERKVGGAQADMADCMRAWEEIAAADASAGWSLMANSTGTAVPYAYCSEEAVAEIYGGPELPIMAGMLGPGARRRRPTARFTAAANIASAAARSMRPGSARACS